MSRQALVLASITVLIWGSTFAAIRASLLGGYPPGHLVLIRYSIASLAFIVYALMPGVNFRLPHKKDILNIAGLGVIGISLYHIGITFGTKSVLAGTTALIAGSAPVFITIFAVVVLKEGLSWTGWVGLAIGFSGIVLVAIGEGGTSFQISKGVFMILGATIAMSLFFVLQKPWYKRYNPIHLTAYFTWAGTIPFLIFTPGITHTLQHATLEAHLSAIYVGIFPAALAYVLWAIALSKGEASAVSSTMYGEPLVAIIVAWIWLNEWPSTISIAGGLVAILGAIAANHKKRPRL